jgi:hypothetical protein
MQMVTFPRIEQLESHQMDVYLADGRAVDVRIDGESVFPTWFKLEFKENGEVSAKVKGMRLSSRRGDVIQVHLGRPEAPASAEAEEPAGAAHP